MLFNFGQPTNGVIQMGFIVEDLQASMQEFSDRLGVGPWLRLENFAGEDPVYRGKPTSAKANIALGYGGHMQYELIQPADHLPSVHRESIDSTGYGFHHFGYATTDFDSTLDQMGQLGYEVVFSDRVSQGSRIAYFDTRGPLPGMTEIIEAGPELDAQFTPLYLAALKQSSSK